MKRAIVTILVLVILTPIFSYLSELVEYSEPLENVAAMLNVEEKGIYSGIIPDYRIGFLNEYISSIVSAVIGITLTYLMIYIILKIKHAKK